MTDTVKNTIISGVVSIIVALIPAFIAIHSAKDKLNTEIEGHLWMTASEQNQPFIGTTQSHF
jgi:hypothetical protein